MIIVSWILFVDMLMGIVTSILNRSFYPKAITVMSLISNLINSIIIGLYIFLGFNNLIVDIVAIIPLIVLLYLYNKYKILSKNKDKRDYLVKLVAVFPIIIYFIALILILYI